MKAFFSLLLLIELCGCGTPTIIVHETDSVNLECKLHKKGQDDHHGAQTRGSFDYAGCYYWTWGGCVIVSGPGDIGVQKHEARHCREGEFHGPDYTLADMERDESAKQ